MSNEKTYSYSKPLSENNVAYITFDSNAYILKAENFNSALEGKLNQSLVGMNVDELAKIIKESGNESEYDDFETYIHLPLLNDIIKDLDEE